MALPEPISIGSTDGTEDNPSRLSLRGCHCWRSGRLTGGEDEANEGDDLAGTEGEGEEEELPARRSVDKHDRVDEETDQTDEMAGGHEPGGEGGEPAGGQAVHGAEGNRRVDDGEDAETERHEDSREGDDERGDRQAVEKLPNFR